MKRGATKRHRRGAPGTAPGTLSIDPSWPRPVLRVMAYRPEEYLEKEISDPKELQGLLGSWPVVWVNVEGLGSAETLSALAEIFGLHRLAMEDVVNLGQRAKAEEFDEQLFVVLRQAVAGEQRSEQISLFLGEGFVLTLEERSGGGFEPVRQRIRDGKGLMRKAGPDYLVYALVDAVIDGYFPVLESVGNRLEALEAEVFTSPEKDSIARIQAMKSELRELRRVFWPHRDVVNALMREDTPFVSERTRVYLRDCADHSAQVREEAESYLEAATDLMGAYLSSVSNRMNEVMKVLTIVASIFIPLGFLAGIYGMNFDGSASPLNMPELEWAYGYPAVLTLMGLVGGGMALYFWKKGWF